MSPVGVIMAAAGMSCMKKKIAGLLIVSLWACSLGALPRTRTVVVFPFANQSGRADLDWLSEGLAVLLSTRLGGPRRYVLGRHDRNAAYEQLGLPADAPLTLASQYEVAQTLGVDWAVVGSFTLQGKLLITRAQLLDMRRMKLFPTLDASGNLADLVELQTRLAWRLLSAHDPNFVTGKEEDFRRQFRTIRLDAFENYIRGVLASDPTVRVQYLKEANRRDPSDHRAALELGRFYFHQKDYASASGWLKKLQASDPHYDESLFLLGVSEYLLGHDAAAEKSFAALAQRLPLNEVYNNLGVAQFHQGRYAQALASFERAYAGDPDDPQFSFNRAACLWYLGRYGEAAQVLEQEVKLDGEDVEARNLLASAYAKLHNAAGRERQMKWLIAREGAAAMAADPPEDQSPQPRLEKDFNGSAFRLLSLTVHNTLETDLAGKPETDHFEAYLARGKMFLAKERFQEAEHALSQAAALAPEDGQIHLLLGRAYEGEGRHDDALRQFETSLRLHDNVAAHLWMGRVYLALNRLQEARVQGHAALALDPKNADAQSLMAQIGQHTETAGSKP